ncbi:MAG: hypothetical protein K6U87_05610 [Firmicutes bacterium]|nr:hypothetical protein [Bacillota bacterium]
MNTIRDVKSRSLRESSLWLLWIDSDILVPPREVQVIAEALLWAEENRCAVAANYLMANGLPVVMDREGKHYTQEQIDRMPPYYRIGFSGFGFLYLEQPLNYLFHADDKGEDIHFWLDHPDIPLYLATRIRLAHKKTVILMSPRPTGDTPIVTGNES